jgi:ABC-type uncharacterized transport system permease subunit
MILDSASPSTIGMTAVAAFAYVWPAVRVAGQGALLVRFWVGLAWLLHATLLALSFLDTPARFGFAPALSVTAWLIATSYAVERQLYPQLPARWALSAVGALSVILALVFPGSALPSTASVWLPLHLAMGVSCYGLFGVAVVHAWFMTRAEARMRQGVDTQSGLPMLTLERLTYRFVAAGFVLLTATLAVGYGFGDVVYGHAKAWRWDHKTVFSVLSWLTFAVLLVGRSHFGWRGKRAVVVLYTGSALLFLAYVGSRFVLEVVLGRVA